MMRGSRLAGSREAFGLGTRLRGLVLVLALAATQVTSAQARSSQQVRIGIGFGLAFLPAYICQDMKLIEKYAKEAHLDVRASYVRLLGPGPMEDGIATGAIDVAPYGTAPLLTAWAEAKDPRQQILAVSGLTTLPLVLLSDQPDVHSIADLRPDAQIAMPTLSAPQMYILEMQSEKDFGQYDRLRRQVAAMPPSDALTDLIGGASPVKADFASPPFTEIALKDGNIHPILRSEDVTGGKASFLILGARRSYIAAHAAIADVIGKAMDDAARLIHDDPVRAARIYLTHEPSKALDAADIAAVLADNKDEFGSAVQGVQTFADFMSRHGELKTPPKSWKDIVAPSLLNSPSS
jgi:NitT/TauT family transport system substrate-binding protein